MSSRKGSWGPYEFTRAASEEVLLSQASYNVTWAIACLPTKRAGVWALTVQVLDTKGRAVPPTVVRYQAEWPNSTTQSFEAFLYGLCHRTARMVEEWAVGERAEQERARQA